MTAIEEKARENAFAAWLQASLDTPEIVFMTMERVGETMNLRRFTAVRDYDAGFAAGRLAALDEAAETVEKRRQLYLQKAERHDPLDDDTMNQFEGKKLCAEAMEWAKAEIEALKDTPSIASQVEG